MDPRTFRHTSLLPPDADGEIIAPPVVYPERYIVGCDPGQSVDPTAIAVIKATADRRFLCGHLERLPLNTPYPAIAIRVKELIAAFGPRTSVVLDLTGVGRPVNDLFLDRGIKAVCVTITAGHDEVETDQGYFSVPKLTLISRVQSLLHDGRLQIQKDLPETPALVAELQDFRATVTDTGRWTFGARSGAHDDLVLALALACWYGARPRKWDGHVSDATLQTSMKPLPVLEF
jgi:hypothetical protein